MAPADNALAQRLTLIEAETIPAVTSPAVASALRTIGTERDGLACLMEAIGNGLGAAFTAAVARIAGAKGRAILTGMGKSGHVGRKIAATLASTGTPALYVHPAEASHGDLGMVQPEGRGRRSVLVRRDHRQNSPTSSATPSATASASSRSPRMRGPPWGARRMSA